MTEDQLVLLRDKHTLWVRASKEGAMDLRDYNHRMAEALGELLAEYSAPKLTLPAGEWTDEQVEAAARAIEALGLYVANGFVSGLMARDAACAALTTITPTAGGCPTTATTTKEK